MGTITGRYHKNPLKTARGVAETRLTVEKLLKAHLPVMETITEKFHQNPLKTVGGDAETRLCLRTDGLTDGRTDEPITIVPFD